MATKKEEIVAIAEAQGYEGDTPSTIAEAVNALGSVMGGGGSGGGGNLVKVTFSFSETGPIIADKTNKEIYDLYSEGALIYFSLDGVFIPSDGISYMNTTSYRVSEVSDDACKVDVYALYGKDDGMGAWSLKGMKITSTSTSGSNKEHTSTRLS